MGLIEDHSGELVRLLSAAKLRAEVLAANVANLNTPGYRRREVQFESLLLNELRRGKPDLSRVQPKILEDALAKARSDGNTVLMEKEISEGHKNKLLFELYAAILAGNMRLLDSAVNGGT